MTTWSYTWNFDDPDDLDYWMIGQWTPAYGGALVQNTAESGQSAGTVNIISTISLGECSPGDVIVAHFDWSLYIYEQDYTPNWTVNGRLRFTDGLGNVLAVDTEPVIIGPQDGDLHTINLEATAPDWAEYVQLQAIWTVGNNFSSVYSFFVDSVYIEGTGSEPEPEPEPSRLLGLLVRRGFRLPYERTELKENMLFVEGQLEQYLHEHVGLDVRRVGFRFPRRDFNNESAKMENARYLQTQLELYLHDHVKAEQEEEEGGINL